MSRIDRWCAATILFLNGWLFALPVTDRLLPLAFRPIQVVHGVFAHEALLIAYLGLAFIVTGAAIPRVPRGARAMALVIVAFGCLGILSAAVNARPLREFAGAGRYFLLAAYFVIAAMWSQRFTPVFVVRNFLLGLVAAGSVNLFYSFKFRVMELGGLPFLLGQNGPGPHLALAVVLGAWLMINRSTRRDTAIAIAGLLIGGFAASISFSKIAMLVAAFGIAGWMSVTWRDLTAPKMRRWYLLAFALLAVLLGVKRDSLSRYAEGVNTFIEYKFKNLDQDSIDTRSQYFIITAEILARNPAFGVGYGGFYYAAVATDAYRRGPSATEDPEAGARGESNPHNTFLYYAAANGVPGLINVLLAFGLTLTAFRRSLRGRGVAGVGLWASMAAAYLVFGLTVPTLFNTAVAYLPAAAAGALGWTRNSPRFSTRPSKPVRPAPQPARVLSESH